MNSMTIGPFTVHELNVEQGLQLVQLAQENEAGEFQVKLLLSCIKKDGNAINNESFAELFPHYRELMEAAYKLNGFLSDGGGKAKK